MQATRRIEKLQPKREAPQFTWDYVHSAGYDWTFFLAPFWVTAAYALAITLFPSHDMAIFLASYVLIAETHFASTWLIFLDPVNREYYRSEKMVYFYIPALIMLGCVGVSFFFNLRPVMFVAAVVSAVHVMRQSTGIVALYRRRIGERDDARRKFENLAIYSTSLVFLGVGFIRFYLSPDSLPQFLSANTGLINLVSIGAQTAIAVCGLTAAYCIFNVLNMERMNFQSSNKVSLSRMLVFTYSLLLYSPYLFATRMEHAIAMGVGIHYVQYLGIVWWLNQNKYSQQQPDSDWGLKVLGFMSRSVWARLPYLLGYALVMVVLREYGLTNWSEAPQSWLYAIPIGLQFCHYHLDAYLWRFSNPFVRNTVLKYL